MSVELKRAASEEPIVEGKKTKTGILHEIYPDCLKLREAQDADVGVLEYFSEVEGFNAIFKHIYEDFGVSEVSVDGDVAVITSANLPQEDCAEERPLAERLSDLAAVVGDELAQKVLKFAEESEASATRRAEAKAAGNKPAPEDVFHKWNNCKPEEFKGKILILSLAKDKDQRRAQHQTVKALSQHVDTTATDLDGELRVAVVQTSAHDRKRSEQSRWPKTRPTYLRFVMEKTNFDTMDAINFISKRMNIKPNVFSYAGIKDKRGFTSQFVTAHKVHAPRLADTISRISQIETGNYEYVSEQLRLGDLSSNRFTIVLRGVSNVEAAIKGCEALKNGGTFVNYFGLQRFGTGTIGTHAVGRAILQGDYQTAVDAILQPSDRIKPEGQAALRIWHETKDAQAALNALPKFMRIERDLLWGLVKGGGKNALMNGLTKIPPKTRLLYTHAYQSYVFNWAVTARLRRYGRKLVVGDLVQTNFETRGVDPEILTQEMLDSGKYTLGNLVLPLIGANSILPGNTVADDIRDVLASDKMTFEGLNDVHSQFKVNGTYRKVFETAGCFTWDLVGHDDFNELLTHVSTSSKAKKDQIGETSTTVPKCHKDYGIIVASSESPTMPDATPASKHLSLRVSFNLNSSTYATMCLKEIMRCDTSKAFHRTLSAAKPVTSKDGEEGNEEKKQEKEEKEDKKE